MTIHRISLLLIAPVLIAFSSCSDESDPDSHGAPIKFSSPALATSRSTPVTTATITDFGVFASLNQESLSSSATLTPNYMYDVPVTAASSWSPAGDYYWPGNRIPLRINAYSPYAAKGITRMPDRTAPGEPAISFTVPSDPTQQPDLLRATPVNASESPCSLTFSHALAAVTFSAGDALPPCTVTSITLSGIPSSGTLSLESGVWSDISTPADFTLQPDVTLAAAQGSTNVAPGTAISPASATLMLIPQTLPSTANLTVVLTPEGGTPTTRTISLSGIKLTAGLTTDLRLSL